MIARSRTSRTTRWDVSGTRLELAGVHVRGAGDKALSAGEASLVEGERLTAVQARIGVASKDASEVELRDVEVRECEYGLAAYQKKAEYAPSRIVIEGAGSLDARQAFLRQRGSTIRHLGADVTDFAPRKEILTVVYGNEEDV